MAHRTQGTGYVEVGGKRLYIDQNPPTVAGSIMDAAGRNMIQEEICVCIETAGLTVYSTAAADEAAGYGSQLHQAIFSSAAIDTAALATGAVTTAKLASGAVTNTELALLSVGTGEIIDNAVTGDKLAVNSVTTAKIVDDDVTTAKIADSAVTYAKQQFIKADFGSPTVVDLGGDSWRLSYTTSLANATYEPLHATCLYESNAADDLWLDAIEAEKFNTSSSIRSAKYQISTTSTNISLQIFLTHATDPTLTNEFKPTLFFKEK